MQIVGATETWIIFSENGVGESAREANNSNGIAFCQVVSDCNNQMIILYNLPFPLNNGSFRKPDLLKRSKLITLSRIPLSSAHCMFNALLMSMPFP